MSRYDVFRRRIAPVAFVLAIGAMAYQSCNKHHRTDATFVLDFGAAAHQVHSVEADVWINDAPFSSFHRDALPGLDIGPTRFDVQLPSADAELRIDVDLGSSHRQIVRRVHVQDGAVIDVPLAYDLR